MADSSPSTENLYSNDAIYEKCHDILVRTMVDVNFIFETEGDNVVKVSANKACLAASSPVFNVMFNGDLREEGDIKIVDVSAAAFKEFLQFFYERKVRLTLDNVSDVMKLIDKYDVAGGYPICIHFLKETLTIEDIAWGLHLAIRFRLDELKTFCIDKVQNHYKTLLDTIRFGDDGKVITSIARLTEVDWNAVLPHIFMASQSVIRTISQRLDDKCAIYSVTLSKAKRDDRIFIRQIDDVNRHHLFEGL
ncbi:hypothetical protein HA402_005209 [Bradysia odoriphaga]|nr:hypothetical protein HA402_005209 [Bradysia odoriphaga]